MREIKFRAWHKPTQLMDDVALIDFYNDKIGTLYADPFVQGESMKKYSFNEIVLMQSTGLKDKNGVEIFEGDIVENTTQRVYLGHRFEVSWNGGYACFQLLNGGKSSNVPLIQDFMSYEVVGNIYENQEFEEVEG